MINTLIDSVWQAQVALAHAAPVFVQPMTVFVMSINLFLVAFIFLDAGLLNSYPALKPVSLAPPNVAHKKRGNVFVLALFTLSWNGFAIFAYRIVDYCLGTTTSLFWRGEAQLWHDAGFTSAYTQSIIPMQQENTVLGAFLYATTFEVPADLAAPSALRLLLETAALLVLWDAIFYWVHRLLHVAVLRNNVHTTHHDIQYCTALIIYYVDFLDGLVNYAAILLPVMLLRSHPLSLTVFYFLVAVLGATSHSGYDVALGSSRYHYIHHMKHNVNFGALGLQDYLFGTYMSMDTAVATSRDYWPADGTLSDWATHHPYLVSKFAQRRARRQQEEQEQEDKLATAMTAPAALQPAVAVPSSGASVAAA